MRMRMRCAVHAPPRDARRRMHGMCATARGGTCTACAQRTVAGLHAGGIY